MEELSHKAKESFKMGLDFIQKKAKESMDRVKLQGQLTKVRDDKQQALLALAERVCAMFDMDTFSPEDLKDSVETVRELQQQIQALEKQLQELAQQDHQVEHHQHPTASDESTQA